MKPDYDRRCALRVHAPQVAVELIDFKPQIRDLSEAGIFIEDPRPLPAGRTVRLAIRFSAESEAITVWGMVRRVEEGKGMGIEFLNISAPDKDALRTYLGKRIREEGGKESTPY